MAPQSPPSLLISGASGMIGSALTAAALTAGHPVRPLVRRREQDGVFWNPATGEIDAQGLDGTDVVVHLAGENIASGRWTAARKARILDSRVQGATLLSQTLARLDRPPRALLCASAVGFYGDTGEAEVDESAPPGEGFLPQVCREWEAACAPAAQAGVRIVHLRFAVVLGPRGGALGAMLPLFRLGLGGRLGSGRQFMSWVHLDDAVRAILRCAEDDGLSGPVNVVAPGAVTNREFTRVLSQLLRRPALAPAPAWALRLVLGAEMANETLLASVRATPRRLMDQGFAFQRPTLEAALRQCLEDRGLSVRPAS